ncbi:MAG: trimeric intracellular cation channel family protein [Burkholderiales bacterium]|nr:trimeric intracellular cation channel family protein [Burkholderiales bacterium]
MLLYLLELFGVAVFAISGALVAARKHMDPFGVIVIAVVTAIGGGTLRDVLLDRHPIFWFENTAYLVVIIAAAVFTMIYTRHRTAPMKALLIADAFGLALFTVSGAQIAEQQGLPGIIVVLMATITGTAGGMLRDMLCAEVPLILRHEIYATTSLAGAAVYVAGKYAELDVTAVALAAMVTVFALRMAAIFLGWHQPQFTHDGKPPV